MFLLYGFSIKTLLLVLTGQYYMFFCFFFVSNYEFFEDPSSFSAMSAELPVFLSVVFFVVQLQKFSNYSM